VMGRIRGVVMGGAGAGAAGGGWPEATPLRLGSAL